MDEFVGKVALITGAGRGSGREIALAFSALGATVAANDINPLNLDETVNQVLQAGGNARSYLFDTAKRMPIEGLVAQVMEHFDRIDILVNHASVEPKAHLLDMDEWEFHRTLDVNLGGPFFCMQQVGRVMRESGAGVMVNIISFPSGVHTPAGYSALVASQAGLLGLTRPAALELSAYHIRLNAVYTGPEDDTFLSNDLASTAFHRWRKSLPKVPLGDHPDLVSLVLFLCSGTASSLNGKIYPVKMDK